MLIFLVLGMGIVVSVSRMQINRSTLNVTDNASENFSTTQAHNLAMSGVEQAVMRLSLDTNWLSGYTSNNVGGGALTVAVARSTAAFPGGPPANLRSGRLVTSTGTVAGETRTVQAIIQIPMVESVPRAMQYAMFSNGDLELTGNLNVVDDNNRAWNADIHTNAALKVKGNNTVRGYGTYFSYLESTPAKNADATFVPNVLMGGPVHHQAPKVELPEINPSKWATIATKTSNGDPKLAGNTVLGTRENPVIWYVNGNLTLSGNVSGYGVFLVTGNLFLNGNVTINTLDPSGNNLGIIVGGDAQVNGNVKVAANILTKGDYLNNGNVTITGSIVAGGRIDLKGSVLVKYRPPLAKLTGKIWATTPGRPQIVSYYDEL